MPLTFIVATIGINIVANFVSPAFDFANVSPKHITFLRGGMIAAVGSVFVMPWHLFNSPLVIHYTLDTLGAAIGPLYGVLIAHFYLVHKQKIAVDELFTLSETGTYFYRKGYNPAAIYATAIAAVCSLSSVFVPGIKAADDYSWFIGCGVAFLSYVILASRMGVNTDKLDVAPGLVVTGEDALVVDSPTPDALAH